LGEPSERISIEAAQQRFRARAFSQKQLSTLVNSRKMAAEQITGIAAAESIDKRQSIEQDIVKAKRGVATSFQKVVQLWTAEADSTTSTGLVADLDRRRLAVKKKLEESGLDEVKQQILDQAPIFKSAQTLFAEVGPVLTNDMQRLQGLVSSIPAIHPDAWTKAASFIEVSGFFAEVETRRQAINVLLGKCREELVGLEESRRSFEEQFQVKLNVFVPQYKDLREQQASMKSLMEEGTRIERELDDAEKQDRKNKESVTSISGATEELRDSRALLDSKMAELQDVLVEAATRVSVMSGGSLQAIVKQEAIPRQHVEALAKLCENQRVRDASMKCEERVTTAIGTSEGWGELVNGLMDVYEGRVKGNRALATPTASPQVINELQLCLFTLTTPQAQGIYAGLDDAKLAALLTAATESFISFTYKDRGGFIAFEKASPGQQAAALLHLLLRQEGGTLIIDQPEDDLDNKIIMDIVKLVTTAKRKRQLIFTTHNANFVVNGDADKVIALMPGSIQDGQDEANVAPIAVEVDGSIETIAVRTLISDTVEGGRAAFELRGRKYFYHQQ
jgi:chromosome segregation protein